MGMVSSEQEASDRDLGLDLLGKPRDQDLKFAELRNIEFAALIFGNRFWEKQRWQRSRK